MSEFSHLGSDTQGSSALPHRCTFWLTLVFKTTMNDRTNSTDVRLSLVSLQSIYTSGLGLCCTFPSKLTSLACSYVSALGTGVRQHIHGKGCHYIHMEFGFGRGAVCYQCIRGGATHPVDIKPVQSPQHRDNRAVKSSSGDIKPKNSSGVFTREANQSC